MKAPRAISRPGAAFWRRLAFIGVNLLAAGLTAAAVAPVWRWAFDETDALADRRELLARQRAVVAQEHAVRDYAGQVRESNARGDLLEGGAAGVVNAALQARLKAMSEAAGVTILSIEALPPRAAPSDGVAGEGGAQPGAPQLHGARLAFSGTLEATHQLTVAIETGPPLMRIAAASMTQTMAWRPDSGEAKMTIQSQFDVYAGALERDRP